MARGEPVPDDVEVTFRTHYLRTGNIRAAARQAKIPERTGQDLATRAQADPEFTQARAAMYARALPDAERMLVSALEIAYERLEAGPESIGAAMAEGASKITIQDPGPQYLRGIADGAKVLATIRKAAEPTVSDKPIELHVHLKPDAEDPQSGGPSASG